MAVRLTIKINSAATVSALANSGYETDECEILVPLPFAKDNMGLSLKDGKAITYIAADKKEVRFYQMGKVKVRVITDDKKSEYVEAALLVSESEEQVVLNDKLVGGLGIVFLNVAEGTWRFSDDPTDKLRESSMPQLFH